MRRMFAGRSDLELIKPFLVATGEPNSVFVEMPQTRLVLMDLGDDIPRSGVILRNSTDEPNESSDFESTHRAPLLLQDEGRYASKPL